MLPDLTALIPADGGRSDALEAFVSGCLVDGGVWEAPRESDGIVQNRILERTPDRLRLCGRIYSIDQALHTYWLDVTRDAAGPGAVWILYFDAIAYTERQERNAWVAADRAEQLEWRVVLAGTASFGDGGVVPRVGSARAGCPLSAHTLARTSSHRSRHGSRGRTRTVRTR